MTGTTNYCDCSLASSSDDPTPIRSSPSFAVATRLLRQVLPPTRPSCSAAALLTARPLSTAPPYKRLKGARSSPSNTFHSRITATQWSLRGRY
jgi:hypothetical protein